MSSPSLYILMCSGEHEKIQMAAMCASVAAVSERPVEVFLSMGALGVFRKSNGDGRYSGGEFSQMMLKEGAPDPIELFEGGKMLGDLKVYACSMAMDVAKLSLEDLEEKVVDQPGGLTKFLSDAESGQLIVF